MLKGVKYRNKENIDNNSLHTLQNIENIILQENVSYRGYSKDHIPWLLGLKPFEIEANLAHRLLDLGKAFFSLYDWVQSNYLKSVEIRSILDIGVPAKFAGLELNKRLKTFRLDCILRNNIPVATEMEEVYGSMGKLIPLSKGYDIYKKSLIQRFIELD